MPLQRRGEILRCPRNAFAAMLRNLATLCAVSWDFTAPRRVIKFHGAFFFVRFVASFYDSLYDLFINFKIHHFKFTARNFNFRA